MNSGKFVISLDFELQWGVRDKFVGSEYQEHITDVHTIVPGLLDIFDQYNICATFATVGMLFHKDKNELLSHIPALLPAYDDKNLSPYNGHFNKIGDDHLSSLLHFAPHLIRQIRNYPAHEIGSHTYSHYYCLEPGQQLEAFKADMEMACQVADEHNVVLASLVFPRNQFNEAYLEVCAHLGITCYRGNEVSWLYRARNGNEESKFRRALRLMDAYVNISGHNCHTITPAGNSIPLNIPSSRFLRPFSPKLSFLDGLRLQRITSGMTYAAKNDRIYHLWWHPHNFGVHQKQNFAFLGKILQHYKMLNYKYGFSSVTMTDLATQILNGK